MSDSEQLAAAIRRAARECGYLDCGIASAEPFTEYEEGLRERCRRFPSATGLYEPMLNRVDPRKTAPWAEAVVVAVRDYGKYALPPGLADHIGRNYLCDRRVAACPDHEMPRHMTAALKRLGLRVKRGGVPERAAGVRAGVVSIGRNGFAYHREAGSWINLESWRIDGAPRLGRASSESPCPDGCRACLAACPTRALREPFVMRMDLCIAYLTYSAPAPIAADLWRAMGPWIYGCDACQLACPLNRGKWRRREPTPWLEKVRERLRPEALASMDEATYREVVHPLFWYIPETGVERWRRNAARAAEWLAGQGRCGD